MKSLVFGIVVVLVALLPLTECPAANGAPSPPRKAVDGRAYRNYENATLSEDVTWSGTVLIKGYVVIAPQVTLRIDPGTNVRFVKVDNGVRGSRLVIMGRIQSVGTADRPILFASDAATSVKGDWGGVLLLSTEKRNQFEHVAIEGADIGIEARYSNFDASSLRIALARSGLVVHDGVVTVASGSFSASDTGIEVQDSEFELRDSSVSNNHNGMVLSRSSIVMAAASVTDNDQYGLQAEECRLRLSTCDISGNGFGAQIRKGDGQIFMTRFLRNKDTALQLVGARLKINRSLIADNSRVGLRVEDGRTTIWGCAFSGNGSYHLYNNGREDVSAVQNWWGSSEANAVAAKIYDSSDESRTGSVQYFPWLANRPAVLP